IYLFKTKVLMKLLNEFPDYDDFGSDIIPQAIKTHKVFGFDFEGYWQDIGTIRSFYETGLMLTKPDSPFNFHDAKEPIYTDIRFLPGSIVEDCRLKDVLLAEGCRILRSDITHSIVGIRSQIAAGCVIKDTIVMGSDYYERDIEGLPIGIGESCHIEGAILDKNVRIGSNVIIRPFPHGTDIDQENEKWYVRDGIVVIPKDAEIESGTKISPE
ncbi:partial Glucose-1-phosphate adenylyltransferase, partial [Anaerolineales bacterium]